MELDKAATFTVTAEKGNTQAYTIIITKAKSLSLIHICLPDQGRV